MGGPQGISNTPAPHTRHNREFSISSVMTQHWHLVMTQDWHLVMTQHLPNINQSSALETTAGVAEEQLPQPIRLVPAKNARLRLVQLKCVA